jgi:hypothetical protein
MAGEAVVLEERQDLFFEIDRGVAFELGDGKGGDGSRFGFGVVRMEGSDQEEDGEREEAGNGRSP